jgi:hypothetical protein
MNLNVGTTERIIRAVIGLILLSLVFVGPQARHFRGSLEFWDDATGALTLRPSR